MGKIMGFAERFKSELENQDLYSKSTKVSNPNDSSADRFSVLRSELLNKIKKTPYWSDFSQDLQENLILKYFAAKNKRHQVSYSSDEEADFLKSVIDKISL